jgi:hypothetical protein
VLRTASIELINAHSTILTGHVPGFPPGHSTVVYSYLLWFTLTYTPIPTSIPSLLPPRIDRASISHDSPAKSWSIQMSITNQITDPPTWLVHMSFLYTASLPFSFPRNIPLFREVLSFYGRVYQGTAKSWRSPYAIS